MCLQPATHAASGRWRLGEGDQTHMERLLYAQGGGVGNCHFGAT
jgi:hypothetical protein